MSELKLYKKLPASQSHHWTVRLVPDVVTRAIMGGVGSGGAAGPPSGVANPPESCFAGSWLDRRPAATNADAYHEVRLGDLLRGGMGDSSGGKLKLSEWRR